MDHEIPGTPKFPARPQSGKGADPHGRREHPPRQRQPLRPRLQRGIGRHCAAAEQRGREGFGPALDRVAEALHQHHLPALQPGRCELRRGPLRTRLRPDLRRTGLRRIDRRAPGPSVRQRHLRRIHPQRRRQRRHHRLVVLPLRAAPTPSPPPRSRRRASSAETRPPPARSPPPPPARPPPAAADRSSPARVRSR